MKAIDFEGSTHVYAVNQPEYLPLPTHKKSGIVTSCYELSFKERLKVLFGATVWVSLMTFDKPLQPQKVSVEKPF